MEESLKKLPAPTALQWGVNYPLNRRDDDASFPSPSSFSWKLEPPLPRTVSVEVFRRDGIKIAGVDTSIRSETGFTNYSADLNNLILYRSEDISLQSGDYYFTVQALGDQIGYVDSDTVRSGLWTYLRSQESLPAVQAVWQNSRIQLLSGQPASPYFKTYCVKIYREIAPKQVRFFSARADLLPQNTGLIELPILEHPLPSMAGKRFFFKICAVSRDITLCQNGPWSILTGSWVCP